jgi:hypothetical protein
MMKLSAWFIASFIFFYTSQGQINLPQFNKEEAVINKNGFIVLGSSGGLQI